MSEIDKRSRGFRFNPDVLAREIANGTAGYDITPEEIIEDDLSVRGGGDQTAYLLALAEQEVDRVELTYEQVKAQFEEIVSNVSIANHVELIYAGLAADYDKRKAAGQPIGPEYYEESLDLAEALVAVHTDYDREDFAAAASAIIQLQYAERALEDAERELMTALAA